MSYAIADYLPKAAISAMVRHRYHRLPSGVPHRSPVEWCPLGVGLTLMDPKFDYRWPEAANCMEIIFRYLADEERRPELKNEADLEQDEALWQTVFSAIEEFADDWDAGRITDLAAALGVKK